MTIESSEQPTLATTIPTQPGAPSYPPPPTPAGTAWYRKRWVLPLATGLIGLAVGSAASGGETDVSTTNTSSEQAPAAADTSALDAKIDDLGKKLASAEGKAKAAEDRAAAAEAKAAAAAAKPAAPVAPAAPAPAAPAGGTVRDGSFEQVGINLKDDGLGDFGGTIRVKNISDKSVEGAILTITIFKGDAQVGTATGSVQAVGPGETQTVQLISSDPFVTGDLRTEFQVDMEY